MGMREVPEIYVVQGGGMLNAFALRFMRRNYVVLLADIVELARNQGEDALAFVIAHELAHHHEGHTGWKRLLTLPARWIPFAGSAYSRACEYTCDAYAADLAPRGAVDGLLVLAAGKHLYREIDPTTFLQQADEEEGFWVTFAELTSTHPFLTKRVAAVRARVGRLMRPLASEAQALATV
jgi:Zn-dependent protease with chaperone function